MRKITKLLLTAALLIAGVSGVEAEKTNASFVVATGCSWDAGTNTLSFTDVNGWQILLTGLPSGDISAYTKFHATLSAMSDNIENIRLRIKDTSDNYADVNLVVGENNVDLKALAEANPSCDFTSIADITIWSPTSAIGTVNAENAASVVITNAYMFNPTTTIAAVTGFGDEITSLDGITDGTRFVIGDGANVLYFSGSQDAKGDAVAQVPYDSYFYYTLTNIEGLDLDEDGNADTDIYAINIFNEEGTAFPAPWGLGNNVNFTNWGSIFSGSAQADKAAGYGTDTKYQGIWKVAYSDGNGFTFKNCSLNKYMKVNGSQDEVCYLKLYNSLVIDKKVIVDYDKQDNAANDEIFALSKMADGAWTFETPVDLSDWDYIMITTSNTAADESHEITITDVYGVTVSGEAYSGGSAGTGGNMWLDRWNNQNAIRISLDYLRINKGMDISKIKELKINGTISVANAYLTDYNNTKVNGGYAGGDAVREYTETGKYGTICLPYVASYAGCEVYSIESKSASGINLTKVTGLLEAGKPYIFKATDENGRDNAGAVRNANFFRADVGADVAESVANNGLIGTFSEIAVDKKETNFVLSGNKLYFVDSDVKLAANRAYVDLTQVPTESSVRGDAFISFNEATGIQVAEMAETQNGNAVYDLSGRKVVRPAHGLYIVNGKKVVIK